MQQAFRALLTGSAAVTALVPAARIEWGVLGQGRTLPAVRMFLISNIDGLTMQGPDGLWRGRVQVDVYAETYASAQAVAGAIISILHGHRAGAFRGIFLAARRDDYEANAADRPQRISLDFFTNWRAGYAD